MTTAKCTLYDTDSVTITAAGKGDTEIELTWGLFNGGSGSHFVTISPRNAARLGFALLGLAIRGAWRRRKKGGA